jgi:hypothetical protein
MCFLSFAVVVLKSNGFKKKIPAEIDSDENTGYLFGTIAIT